ncbi:hypothetical protein FJV41_07340 [Myxococcus llanfairpwllgwyngyllgogerychwyrndrobwllllantysiliogogogochensis]|uniref:Lipoprotein n=1 Tax=Myxococcus llanfairpwllgwyngyllgogerychwyrndrobwllllantysiliogogogochensis TaxID=2590453 RepID=A0A540X5U7_9BACT|nr:hypothetical protein [Myxococcus llanfairpwllgwyngyllgogerychwyrndrobwllllantysiliogogogochensis]TQF16627.1 hypothetical protein FJV41_07340 [Myxococcus llanfairpwllgwyngyllgogerychwyrndrobwllllantysiliogogogochensis]
MTPRACVLWSLVWLSSACASRGHLPSTPPPPAEYGTPHPFLLQAAAPDGRWLLACQAREDTNKDGTIAVRVGSHGQLGGDEARLYLFREPGAGLAVDDVLAVDSLARHIVLVREGALRLLDTVTGTEQVLAPWTADDVGTNASQPPVRASFSRDGQRLLYLKTEAGKKVAVLRDVARGEERVLDAGPGLLGQARLHENGLWAVFDVVAQDTDEDGTLTWPHQQTSLAPARCRGPVSSASQGERKGDSPVRRFLRVDGGTLIEGRDILQPLGDGLLRTLPHGAIAFEDARGNQQTWVPESCRARLYAVDEPRRLLVVGCKTRDPLGTTLELHGPELHLSLEREVSPYAPVRRSSNEERPRLLPTFVLTSKDTERTYAVFILDMERHTLVPPPIPASTWVHAQGSHALLREDPTGDGGERRRPRLWLWNADTGEKRLVGEASGDFQERAGERVLYMGWLMDLGTGQVLGPVTEAPLAIDTRGGALRYTHAAPAWADPKPEKTVPLGPVKWEPAVNPSVKPTSPPGNTSAAPSPSGP